jgi:hypothetical protein
VRSRSAPPAWKARAGCAGRRPQRTGAISKTEQSLIDEIGQGVLDRINDDLREPLLKLEGPAP